MLSKLFVAFSTTANSFKNKSKLTEFYKAIHPDMLQNAPDNVKMENTRSLKILNSYFDAVSQNERTEPQEITFFMPDKQNNKARNFIPLTLVLDAFLQRDQQAAIDKVTKQINEQLNQKQQEIRKTFEQKMGINPFLNYENDYNRVKTEFVKTTISVKKRPLQNQTEQQLRASIFSAQMQSQSQEMMNNISREMRKANMPYIKPQLWTSILMEKCDLLPNLYQIFEQLIDPRLIFFDNKLNTEQSSEFVKRLVPTLENSIELQSLSPLFKKMESCDPQICLYVTDHFGANDIPGYFSIPYNFDMKEIHKEFGKVYLIIKQERQSFEKELKKYQQSLYNLADKYGITKISNEVLLNNTNTLKQLNLSLLILNNQLEQVNKQRLSSLKQKNWILSQNVNKTIDSADNFYIPIPFSGVI